MLQRQQKLIGYLAKFLGLFGLFFYGTEAVIALSSPEGYYSSFVAGKLNFIDPLRHLLLEASRSLLSLFGFQTYFKDSLTIGLVNGKGVRMVYSCIGYGVLSFWIAFVLANRAPWKKTLGWLVGGCLLLCGINIIRISLLLVAINKGWPIPFGWDHHTWFNIMAYTLIFSMIYGYDRTWKNKTLEKGNGKKQRDLTPEQREVKSLSANKVF